MKRRQLDEFEKLFGQLEGLYEELSVLSKKSPEDAVSLFKLKFINKLLMDSNAFLDKKYRPFDDFLEFDSNSIPQNSDVVFMLAQYLQCFEKFRADNVVPIGPHWCWAINAEKGEKGDNKGLVYVRTTTPKRLRE